MDYFTDIRSDAPRTDLQHDSDQLMDAVERGNAKQVRQMQHSFHPSHHWVQEDYDFATGIPARAAFLAAKLGKKRVLVELFQYELDAFDIWLVYDKYRSLAHRYWMDDIQNSALCGAIAGNQKGIFDFLLETCSFNHSMNLTELGVALRDSTCRGLDMIMHVLTCEHDIVQRLAERALFTMHGLETPD